MTLRSSCVISAGANHPTRTYNRDGAGVGGEQKCGRAGGGTRYENRGRRARRLFDGPHAGVDGRVRYSLPPAVDGGRDGREGGALGR